MTYYILAVNPGSTTTKIAVYKNEEMLFCQTMDHDEKDLAQFLKIGEQLSMRKEAILDVLNAHDFQMNNLSAVVGRGGTISPLKAGGYKVNEDMKRMLLKGNVIQHASNLGALIADSIAGPLDIPAFIYDAVGSDELKEIAKVTGIPEVVRQSYCHVLNSKATARKVAEKNGRKYEDMNFVVAHLGGGISVSAHEKGKIVDVITDDAGPFSPERSGSVPLSYIVDMCYSGEYNKRELLRKIRGMGGLKAHLGTHDCREIEHRIANGDEKAEFLYKAQAYQIAKGIGELSPTLDGDIDAIILTGGVAHSKMLTEMIKKHVRFIAPVEVMPGENELESLALGALRILRGEESISIYNCDVKKNEE